MNPHSVHQLVPSRATVARPSPIGQQARPCSNPAHDGVETPRHARDDRDARRADGAQRLRDRRDDPGAAGDRAVAERGEENHRQLVVVAYFIGFASTQLIWGPLADRFGRKPILAAGIALYGLFALLCAFAGSFPLLIAGAGRDGRLGGGHPGAGRRHGPRPVRGRSDGAGDEPGVHGLHAGAGAGAQHRPGDPAGRARGGRSSSCWPLMRSSCWPGRRCGCPRRCTPNIAARSIRARCRRDRRDRPRAAVARLHARADHASPGWSPISRRSSRSSSTRSRRRTDRPGVRRGRGADGARVVDQLPDRRPLRPAAGRPSARRRSRGHRGPRRLALAGRRPCRSSSSSRRWRCAASPSPRRTSARWRWSIWRRSPAPPRRSRASSARSARRSIGFPIGQAFDGTPRRSSSGRRSAPGGFLAIVLTEPKRLFAAIGTTRARPRTLERVPDDFG